MATFSQINNGDLGSVARGKINAIIDHINSPAYQTLTDAATISWTYSLGYNAKVTITADRSLSIIGATNGDYGTLIITQGGAGGFEINFGGSDLFAQGTHSFSSTPGDVDIYSWSYDGTNYYWNFNTGFA